jgi:hypothetical protein
MDKYGWFHNFYTTICKWFQHKLNYFLFCQNIEKTFTTCDKILIIIIKSDYEVLRMLSLNFRVATSKSEECDSLHTFRLSHNDSKVMFIII